MKIHATFADLIEAASLPNQGFHIEDPDDQSHGDGDEAVTEQELQDLGLLGEARFLDRLQKTTALTGRRKEG